VIARNSTFTYKGKAVDVQTVGKQLSVRYVLEGSVRKSGERVRITAQLVDAKDRHHVWAARFDRELTDIFALQDEITSNVTTALHVRLVEGEQARVWKKSTQNIAAWECLMQGLPHFRRFTEEDNERARSLFARSVELDPQYAVGWVWLGWTYWADARFLWARSVSEAIGRAAELAEKAVTIDDTLSECYSILGAIHLMQGEHDKAIANGERAVTLEPNGADGTALLAVTLNWSGRPEEACALIQKAMRLSPVNPAWFYSVLAHAYRLLERYEEAVDLYEDAIALTPHHIGPHIGLTSCYAELGQDQKARAQAQEILKISPGFTISKYAKSMTYKIAEHSKRSLEALIKAGLPE